MTRTVDHPIDNTDYREIVERLVDNGDINAQGLSTSNMLRLGKQLMRKRVRAQWRLRWREPLNCISTARTAQAVAGK